MQLARKAEVDRENLFAIFMFEEKGAPFTVLGDSWRIVAAAIGQKMDYTWGLAYLLRGS